ncbi:MAG: hypothetical protein Q8M76_03630, partial [Spirochaetaceae bacterium]|nr:hypothetical protein [Spirochaetaceae bacterium]
MAVFNLLAPASAAKREGEDQGEGRLGDSDVSPRITHVTSANPRTTIGGSRPHAPALSLILSLSGCAS